MPPRIKILLAEDDADHQELLVASLTEGRPHVTVDVVDRGKRVIEILHTAHAGAYNCVILDFNLPDQNAAELLSHLKNQASAHFPIIVVSSSNAQGVVIESMRSGSVDFVPKIQALEGDTLWRRVELAIEQAQRKRENRRKIVRRSQQLAKLAERDPLTGLYNRRFLDHLFSKDRRVLDRRGSTSLCMIDLDHFKIFNDQYGHACGDRVLLKMTERIQSMLKPNHIACRWGGEEFLLILPGVRLVEALATAELLRERIHSDSLIWKGETLRISASMGCYACSADELSQDTLAKAIDRADQALYLAKERGRNRVCTWEMVQFWQLVEQVDFDADESLEDRLQQILTRGRKLLGPTQLDHLTDHSLRVAELAAVLADAMKVVPSECYKIRVAGLLHDIGKFIVPERILAKKQALSASERHLIDFHAAEGAYMSRALGVDADTAACIQHHHTRFDVANASSTEKPPLGARILAVSEAFVAMTTPRPYLPTRSIGSAVRELREMQGKQFDPVVVDALVSTMQQNDVRSGIVRGLEDRSDRPRSSARVGAYTETQKV